ncbi:MAG: radical SAM protein [Kiritimatiellae bacterium]|nr:radical SAM protein [Kiritimatiellia bacterium]
MRVFEITAKSALVRSRIPGVDFVINPYLGCGHGCRYCYAVFMRKYSRYNRNTRWGDFVEVKANIVDVLRAELRRRRSTATAHLSSACDPYQPVEQKYRLTRGCLEALREFGWGVNVLTRSPLVTRDLDLLGSFLEASVGMSIGTDDDEVRKVLEPRAPSIPARIETLRKLRAAGLHTWAFLAPMLPMNPERLHELVAPVVESVLFDALNYPAQVAAVFREQGWDYALDRAYARRTRAVLARLFGEKASDV